MPWPLVASQVAGAGDLALRLSPALAHPLLDAQRRAGVGEIAGRWTS